MHASHACAWAFGLERCSRAAAIARSAHSLLVMDTAPTVDGVPSDIAVRRPQRAVLDRFGLQRVAEGHPVPLVGKV